MSGQDAQRGFIYQTIVAMIECLDKPDWDAIKLEPETKNDKVDISFYANGRMLRAIQVKSRSGAFNENDVQGWLDEIEKDAQDEKPGEVWLYLVGSEYKNDCIKFIADVNESGKKSRPKKHIEPLKFQDIKTYCIGKLCGLHGELITSKEVHWTYYTLLGIVHENSISSRKLSRDEFRSVLSDNIKSASKNGNDLRIAKTVRKLSGNLWINWKTGRLGDSLESALYGGGKDECILDSAELRLLSVLVQGEGAVVGWDELVRRGIRMNAVMEELRNRSRVEEESPAAMVREPGSAEAESDDLEKYPSAEEEKEILQKALETAGQYIARGVEIRLEEVEQKVRKAVAAVRRLCGKAPALSGIVKAAENGMGFRIVLPGPGSQSVGDFFPEAEGEKVEETSQKNGYTEAGAWLSRYYADVCSSFEVRISNAGSKYGEMGQDYDENKNAETDVFGGYTMAESYVNAYAAAEDISDTKALLDYAEEWYYSGEKADADSRRSWYSGNKKTARKYGRVLVIHGEPGDGKTTFCKKAVYAHCLEGWLNDVPHVLRISLNPADNETIIHKEKNSDGEVVSQEVFLSKSLCLGGFENNYLIFNPENLKNQEGTLVIFDGYDELDGELAKCEKTRDFAAFYQKVTEFAKNYKCNAIITSRTMCIERELTEKSDRFKIPSVKFAPMTILQQEMMVDRMVELDRGKHGAWFSQVTAAADNGGVARKALESYREQDLPNLRRGRIQELMSIPTLFRMIVTLRFENDSKAETETEAGLYGRLFHSLMLYKNKKNNEERDLIRYYEKIAARVFKHDNDTCPFGIGDDSNNKELLYIFLTKSGAKKEGQIGFLHGSFRQYFLARYLVSGIQNLNAKSDKRELTELIKYLCVRRIEKSFVWQLIYELTKLKGTGQDPFFEIGDTAPVTVDDIKAVRNCLDNELKDMSFMAGIEGTDSDNKPKDWRWTEVESAVFNLLGALSASEKALAESGKESDHYKNYDNITRLLRSGDYQDIYLEKADLTGCDLSWSELKNAQLTSALLLRTTFKGANLLEANLEGADLRGANLARANLAGAVLRNGQFVEANLTKADLSGADLNDAYFDWTKSEGEKKTLFDAEKLTTLREANLSGTKMVNTHFKEAELARAILEKADLRGALLEGANLSGAKLAGADLTGAKMAGADLSSADLRGACLIGADLTGAHMEGACLDRAILKGAILTGAYLERTSLIGAELVGADLTGTHLEGAVLKGAYLDALRLNPNEGLTVSAKDSAAVLDKASLSGADINGAYLSDEQYQFAKAHRALGQPYILTEGGNILFGGDSQKASMIAAGMGGIVFGRYKQGKNGEVLPLRWRVLAVEYEEEKPKRALLITEKLIDCRRYHHNEWKGITWAECGIKKWLNEVFFFEAFSAKERRKIDLTRNENPFNMKYNIDGGKPTEDKVFLLSLNKTKKYFHSDRDRMAEVTKYAITQGSYFDEKGMGWWWLRSPGVSSLDAACVRPGGDVDDGGHNVRDGRVAVRPALWLNL